MTEARIPAIDRLTLTVLPGGKACLFLHDRDGERGVTIDGLPPLDRVRLLKEWARDVASESRHMTVKKLEPMPYPVEDSE